MLPFSLFTTTKVTDYVTLYTKSLRYDPTLYKDVFKIRGVKYTRYISVVTLDGRLNRKQRKGKLLI